MQGSDRIWCFTGSSDALPALPCRARLIKAESLRLQRLCAQPYGGVKESGLGREGVRWAMRDMTEERVLMMASVGAPHSF